MRLIDADKLPRHMADTYGAVEEAVYAEDIDKAPTVVYGTDGNVLTKEADDRESRIKELEKRLTFEKIGEADPETLCSDMKELTNAYGKALCDAVEVREDNLVFAIIAARSYLISLETFDLRVNAAADIFRSMLQIAETEERI